VLVYPNYDGELEGKAAEKWEISEDGLTYTFYVRKGIKFHDGTELNAEDVAFSMQRYLDIGGGFAAWFTRYVEDVTLIDDWTVQFTLSQSYTPFLYRLTTLFILNKDLIMDNLKEGAYGEFGDYGQDYLTMVDAGSGPYKVKEFRLEEVLIMELFEDYWGEIKPRAPKEVHQIGTVEPMTVRTMMKNGELEVTDQWQSPENLEALDAIPGVEIANLQAGSYVDIHLNNGRKPTDCVHYRRALSYLVDYDTVVKVWPKSSRLMGPVPSYVAGFKEDIDYPVFDLEKAEEEFKKSKYYGDEEAVFDLWWSADVPVEEKICLSIAENAEKIGMKIMVTKAPWFKCSEARVVKELCPNGMVLISSIAYPEAGALLETFHSVYKATNFLWVENATVDALLEDMLATIDQEERFQKLYDLQDISIDQAFMIYILMIPEQHAYVTEYMDWPAAEGQVIPLMGANHRWELIEIYPELKP